MHECLTCFAASLATQFQTFPTQREAEVAWHVVVLGESNQEVADSLVITIKTVEVHKAHMKSKGFDARVLAYLYGRAVERHGCDTPVSAPPPTKRQLIAERLAAYPRDARLPFGVPAELSREFDVSQAFVSHIVSEMGFPRTGPRSDVIA